MKHNSARLGLIPALALGGCSSDVAEPCMPSAPAPAIEIASAVGVASAAPIDRLGILSLTVDGRPVSYDQVMAGPTRNMFVVGGLLECAIPCALGASAGEYSLYVRSNGYYRDVFSVTARHVAEATQCIEATPGDGVAHVRLVEADSARVAFQFTASREVSLPDDALTVRFDDGSGERTVGGSDLTGSHVTRNAGELRVTLTVAAPDTLIHHQLTLELRRDWIHSIRVWITNENPAPTCFGCREVWALPLRAPLAGADSAFILLGGNSLSEPRVF